MKKKKIQILGYEWLLLLLNIILRRKMESEPLRKKQAIPRSSKISRALKKSLIDAVNLEGMSVKRAALKLGMNYSTAKVIFRRYRKEHADYPLVKLQDEEISDNLSKNDGGKKLQEKSKQKIRCSYRAIRGSPSQSGSETTKSSRNHHIYVISTVSWDFLKYGSPSFN